MRTIWKFEIYPGPVSVNIPVGGTFLSVQTQGDCPVMWFEIPDDKAPTEARHFVSFGTGFNMGDFKGKYLGTFQLNMGALIFHLYEAESSIKTVTE